MADPNEDTSKYPRLGQIFGWVDRPGNDWTLVLILMAGCTVFLLLDLTYEKHGYMEAERVFGFYAGFGFLAFTGLIFVAKGLRVLTKQREDFYAPHSVDVEPYPEEELGKEEHDV